MAVVPALHERMIAAQPIVALPRQLAPEGALDFDAIYREHARFLWAALGRLGVPDASRDDALQDVFLVVFRRLASFEGRASLRSWLYGIAVRVARAHRRRVRWRAFWSLEDRPELPEHADGAATLEGRDAARVLEELLGELRPERREVFVLSDIEELSAPEVALITGSSVNTVYSRLRLARADFERALARRRARESRGAA